MIGNSSAVVEMWTLSLSLSLSPLAGAQEDVAAAQLKLVLIGVSSLESTKDQGTAGPLGLSGAQELGILSENIRTGKYNNSVILCVESMEFLWATIWCKFYILKNLRH